MCPIFLYIPPPKMIHMFGHYHPVARYIIPHMPYCTICAISFHVCHIFTLLPSMWSTYLSIIICLLCSGLYYIIYICHILHYIPYCTMFDKLYVSMCHIPLFKTILIFGNSNPSPCTLLYLGYIHMIPYDFMSFIRSYWTIAGSISDPQIRQMFLPWSLIHQSVLRLDN